ncbi:tRNA pseudouridine(13) synthase TruD [Utexia brackfieldae]|uniref:tRNA pseudouridine(13) synthase TruD n=1 Tax=Utexia brackfieldae TaxID=3074108 RepID=UPI00370D2673
MTPLAYLHGQPAVTAEYKQQCADFIVKEDLGFEPDGQGEHVLIYLRKTDCNTQFVAEQLAKFAGISAKLATYAGLKDRQAVTEQWFGLHMPGKETPDFSAFALEGCEILRVTRQSKKLRVGVLKGNWFSLMIRDISDRQALDARLQLITQQGVPNYFGEQRFGRDNHNITQAQRWADGEIKVKDRQKRSFYLSAARSAIFNDIVSERIIHHTSSTALAGDALQLTGRGSWFLALAAELPELQQRIDNNELQITAPMVGDDALGTQEAAKQFELQCLDKWQSLIDLLKKERLMTSRRAILLKPSELTWQWIDEQTLKMHFWLPAGSYATSILRELIVN